MVNKLKLKLCACVREGSCAVVSLINLLKLSCAFRAKCDFHFCSITSPQCAASAEICAEKVRVKITVFAYAAVMLTMKPNYWNA